MEKFPTPDSEEKQTSSAESPELSQRERVLEEARSFFEERAREAANPDSGNTYVGGAAKFEAQMKAYVANVEQGKFFDDVEYKTEGQENPITEKSAIAYLLDVRAKNVGLAELWAKDGKEDRAQKYRETAEKVDGFLEAFITVDRKKILGMRTDRRFVADEAGSVEVEGSGEEKLAVINRGGSVERFIDTRKPTEEKRLEDLRADIQGTGKPVERPQTEEGQLEESKRKIEGTTINRERKNPEKQKSSDKFEKLREVLRGYSEKARHRRPEQVDSMTVAIEGFRVAYPDADDCLMRINAVAEIYAKKLQEQEKLYPNKSGEDARASNKTMEYIVRSVLTKQEKAAFEEAAEKEQQRMSANKAGGMTMKFSVPLETSLMDFFKAVG